MDEMDRPYMAWNESAGRVVVSLPHHCEEWEIGGPEEVREMIRALGALLPEFERPDAYRHPHICPRCSARQYMQLRQCGMGHSWCVGSQADWVCTACYYPVQAERRAVCQSATHPERECEMPWCQTCFCCRLGCRCTPNRLRP